MSGSEKAKEVRTNSMNYQWYEWRPGSGFSHLIEALDVYVCGTLNPDDFAKNDVDRAEVYILEHCEEMRFPIALRLDRNYYKVGLGNGKLKSPEKVHVE